MPLMLSWNFCGNPHQLAEPHQRPGPQEAPGAKDIRDGVQKGPRFLP